MSKIFETITACRICGYKGLKDVLNLGEQPLANALVRPAAGRIEKFPLSTAFCPECSLFQLRETLRKEVLFDRYVWVTGTSKCAQEYAGIFSGRVIDRSGLRRGDMVFEIASNDGTVLRQFAARGMKVLGIEPARNIAEMAVRNGVPTDCSYWDASSAKTAVARYGRPKTIIARNVIPHVSDLHGVTEGIASALSDDGTGVIEFHSGAVIARDLHYDSIYHEHLCYFTAHSLGNLLERYGLYPFAVDESPISGGSIVLYFSKTKRPQQPEYGELLCAEKRSGINKFAAWEKFAGYAIDHREKMLDLLKSLSGKVIVGFGASARSATFINFCGIGPNYLRAIIDNNPLKQGCMTPAGDLPIVSFEEGLAFRPDVIFILAWNFAGEIMDECARRGFRGQYIVPFPKAPRVISAPQLMAREL
ncbi:MAG: class I SAM-dependent methyltransferase [Candidatus Omnitrophica bacterium]|nr:class I SAM-dependent methyltransferase [Candidatus Omnitrophota bacterium]